MKSRREFLRTLRLLGAAGAGAQLTRLGLTPAQAQTSSNYKALVCVFLFGGNDANNLVIPLDTTRYNLYRNARGAVALAQNTLLPVNAGPAAYGLHPRFTNLQQLYTSQRAALVFNVGTLVRPTTRAGMNSTPLPSNLFSHSDQTQQWQTSEPTGGSTGWGGRLNDRFSSLNTGPLPPGISLNGGNIMLLNGVTTQGYNFANSSTFGLESFGSTAGMQARMNGLQRVVTLDSGLQLVSSANGVLVNAMAAAQEIGKALDAAPALSVTFPNTGLGNQLAEVARIISVRAGLGMNRQIFFAGIGGFDNHEQLVARQDSLFAELDGALGPFQQAMDALGTSNEVTLFTGSEFNRTLDSNANVGTDHGWGSHHIVMGGAVRGGTAYGTFPVLELRGPDDSGSRGNFIPTTAIDQYAATLGGWFGASDADLSLLFPHLGNFPAGRLNFL